MSNISVNASNGVADRLFIFDTTLRDGEQSPGCSMTGSEKVRIAKALDELGVDVIEAGFPASSQGDWQSVNLVAREELRPAICALARCSFEDIQLASTAIRAAPRQRIHVFLATSEIHRKHKLHLNKEEVLRLASEGVRIARGFCDDVEFSAEDASRTEHDFLAEVIEAVIDAGASTVNIPDTVGYTVPDEFCQLFRYLVKNVRGVDRVRLSTHCHDDLGMAVANSLAAVVAGARQIECTVNGIGERAGNCSLEEVVMALKTRHAFFNVATDVRTNRLYPIARLVSKITGMPIPRNKAVVGENAFAHEAGIHQHGVMKHYSTYEIMRPEDVGLLRSHIVLGKHSGRHAFRARVAALGFVLDEACLDQAFHEFKQLADRKKELFDGDIEAIIMRAQGSGEVAWLLSNMRIMVNTGESTRAIVTLSRSDGFSVERTAEGDGPLDAAFKAIEAGTEVCVILRKFEVRSVSEGEDAQGEAMVYAEHGGRSYRGSSVSTNIIESGTKAFLEVINRIYSFSRSSRSIVDPEAGPVF